MTPSPASSPDRFWRPEPERGPALPADEPVLASVSVNGPVGDQPDVHGSQRRPMPRTCSAGSSTSLTVAACAST